MVGAVCCCGDRGLEAGGSAVVGDGAGAAVAVRHRLPVAQVVKVEA